MSRLRGEDDAIVITDRGCSTARYDVHPHRAVLRARVDADLVLRAEHGCLLTDARPARAGQASGELVAAGQLHTVHRYALLVAVVAIIREAIPSHVDRAEDGAPLRDARDAAERAIADPA